MFLQVHNLLLGQWVIYQYEALGLRLAQYLLSLLIHLHSRRHFSKSDVFDDDHFFLRLLVLILLLLLQSQLFLLLLLFQLLFFFLCLRPSLFLFWFLLFLLLVVFLVLLLPLRLLVLVGLWDEFFFALHEGDAQIVHHEWVEHNSIHHLSLQELLHLFCRRLDLPSFWISRFGFGHFGFLSYNDVGIDRVEVQDLPSVSLVQHVGYRLLATARRTYDPHSVILRHFRGFLYILLGLLHELIS